VLPSPLFVKVFNHPYLHELLLFSSAWCLQQVDDSSTVTSSARHSVPCTLYPVPPSPQALVWHAATVPCGVLVEVLVEEQTTGSTTSWGPWAPEVATISSYLPV